MSCNERSERNENKSCNLFFSFLFLQWNKLLINFFFLKRSHLTIGSWLCNIKPQASQAWHYCWAMRDRFFLIVIKLNKILTLSSCVFWWSSGRVAGNFNEYQLTVYPPYVSEIHWNCRKLVQRIVEKCGRTRWVLGWIFLLTLKGKISLKLATWSLLVNQHHC